MLRFPLFSICLLLGVFSLHGQNISFVKFPNDWQLFQRDLTSNKASAVVSGSVSDSTGYSKIEARLFNESNDSVQAISQNLIFSAGKANFSLTVEIPAATNNHRLEIWAFNSTANQWLLEKTAQKLLAGDIFIINGQSNAQAAASPDLSDIDEYTRSWQQPYGWGLLNLSFPGLWGARLANRIADDIKIPVAIFNQALGALTIDTYLKNPANEYSGNYGSLLKRFEDAGLDRKARAALWFHGEADAWAWESTSYVSNFEKLVNAWKADYGIQQAFLFQMRYQSCTSPRPFIMEAHRVCGDLPGVDIMSTGNAAHDSCHFYYLNGYQSLGDRMFDLVANRFYGKNLADVEAPDVSKIYISGNREITIETKNASQLQVVGSPWNDFETFGGTQKVVNGSVSGNKLVLALDSPAAGITGVSYLGHTGAAPHWIINPRGVNLLTFSNFQISAAPGGGPVNLADLELAGSTTTPNPTAFSFFSVNFSLKNTGTAPARAVKISVPLPVGLVYKGGAEYSASQGSFNHFQHVWTVGDVPAGATLNLTLNYFSFNALAKTVFAQVSATNGQDADSSPGNGLSPNPTEDDEAAVKLNSGTNPPPPPPSEKPDLELSVSADKSDPGQWNYVNLTVTVKNAGTKPATGIEVDFMVQSEPTVWQSIAYVVHEAFPGTDYNSWTGAWTIPNLAAGQSMILKYTAFTKLATKIPVFAQVLKQAEADLDSSPGNANGQTATEDDETLIFLNDPQSLQTGDDRLRKPLQATDIQDFTIFPNPAGEAVQIDMEAWKGLAVRVSVLDQNSVLVFEKRLPKVLEPLQTLDLSGFRNGHYTVQIEAAGKRKIAKKLVVVRDY